MKKTVILLLGVVSTSLFCPSYSREQIMDAINRAFFPDVVKIRCVRNLCLGFNTYSECENVLTKENFWHQICPYLRTF